MNNKLKPKPGKSGLVVLLSIIALLSVLGATSATGFAQSDFAGSQSYNLTLRDGPGEGRQTTDGGRQLARRPSSVVRRQLAQSSPPRKVSYNGYAGVAGLGDNSPNAPGLPTRRIQTPQLTNTAAATRAPVTASPEPSSTPRNCRARRDIELVVGLTIVGSSIEATIRNNSDRCSYQAGVATYKMFNDNIDDQELNDFEQAMLGPGASATFSAALPDCAWQADAFWGEVIRSFRGGVRYGERRLDDDLGGGAYCVPINTPVVTPTDTPKPKPTDTPVSTDTPKPTQTDTPTATKVATLTPTPTPTAVVKTPTATQTKVVVASPTPTPTSTPTAVPATLTPTFTSTPKTAPTSTYTPVVAPTDTPTALPTATQLVINPPPPTGTNTAVAVAITLVPDAAPSATRVSQVSPLVGQQSPPSAASTPSSEALPETGSTTQWLMPLLTLLALAAVTLLIGVRLRRRRIFG